MIEAFVKIVTKWDEILLQSGTAFQLKNCYKVGGRLLQIGTAFLLQIETVYKVGQVLQSERDVVTKWDRCCKVRRLLQSGL